MCGLGCCYEYGYGVIKDKKKAFKLYLKSVEGGYRLVLRSVSGSIRIDPDIFFFRISGFCGFHPDYNPDEKYPV
jgi:hypothetical protein